MYEWGKLPSKGYPEEFPEDTEVHKGELILHEQGFSIVSPTNEMPLKESFVGQSVRDAINHTQGCTYVKVNAVVLEGGDWGTRWLYGIKTMTYIKQASPLTGIEITLIILAICAVIGLTIYYLHPIFYKWAGLSPEEVQAYLGATLGGITLPVIIIAGLIVLALFIFFVWRKR